jgi:MFS superfamily sulfate permease-like transporter
VFWLFCSSKHTAVTITSAISLLIGASLGEISGNDPARHAALAACTALLVAAMGFLAYAVRAGAIVNFFSETVLVGFKCGVAFFLASTQLPKLFGFSGSHGDFWERMDHFFRGLGGTNSASLILGIAALVVLLLGKTILKNKPVALFVVLGGIVAARVLRLDERGVALLGKSREDCRCCRCPPGRADINAIFCGDGLRLVQRGRTTAIGRMFAAKHGYRRRHPGISGYSAGRSPRAWAADSRSAAACRSRSSTKAAGRERRCRDSSQP